MFAFWKIWRALFSSNTRFEIRPFALSPTISELLLTFISFIACILREKFPDTEFFLVRIFPYSD